MQEGAGGIVNETVFRAYKIREMCSVMYTVNNLRMILYSGIDLLSLKLCELLQMTSKLRPVISSGQLPFIASRPTVVKLMVR